jgi:hypothetical protein
VHVLSWVSRTTPAAAFPVSFLLSSFLCILHQHCIEHRSITTLSTATFVEPYRYHSTHITRTNAGNTLDRIASRIGSRSLALIVLMLADGGRPKPIGRLKLVELVCN